MTVRMWINMSTTDFANINREETLVLLPFGSTEQHGPKLPVGTDFFMAEELLRRVKPRINDLHVLILPTLWCTQSNDHRGFDGTISLKHETLISVVHDIASSVSRSGFKKLVLINCHGGNSELLAMMAVDIRQRHDLLVFIPNLGPLFMVSDTEDTFNLHAGRGETSKMLAAHPELVKPGPYEDIGSDLKRGRMAKSFAGYKYLSPQFSGPVIVAWETMDVTKDGVMGNPEGATIEDGERALETASATVEAVLREISRFKFQD